MCCSGIRTPALLHDSQEAYHCTTDVEFNYSTRMSCERFVGWTKNYIQNKNVADSQDHNSDEEVAAVDERIRGFINCAYYDY